MTDITASGLTLGQPIKFSHRLDRMVEYRPNPDYREKNWQPRELTWKVWKRVPHLLPVSSSPWALAQQARLGVNPDDPQWFDGVVVGKRTLQNGIRDWWGSEDGGYQFAPKEQVEAYLIAFHMRRSPVHVMAEDIRLADGL